MSAQLSEYELAKNERRKRKLELLQLYAPRCPMAQLPDRYRVTETNSKPPILHFAFPIINQVFLEYAEKHNLRRYCRCAPDMLSSVGTMLVATQHLSKHIHYRLAFSIPFEITADCNVILGLYSNYTMEDKRLVEEDEEDVIRMVQAALGWDKSIRPKWYFDVHDPWKPGDDP